MPPKERTPRPFDRAFRWLLLTTVFWSYTALASTGEMPSIIAIGGFPLLFMAWIGERHYPLSKWVWRFLTVGAIMYLGWYFQARARTDAIVYLLLFLLVNKLWLPKRPRDILQIYVICFFFMLSASILTMSMTFMFFFIGFVFLIVVGMAFLTVRREHETLAVLGADLRAGINPQIDVPAGFFLRAWGLVLLIFFFTFWIFALFPRFSEQQLLPSMRGFRGTSQTGFADDIRLGSSNRIEMDPTIVMRVMFDSRETVRPLNELYLRGIVLEQYENGSWEANPAVHRIEQEWRPPGSYFALQHIVNTDLARPVRHIIYLNPVRGGHLFMLENATQLRMPQGQYMPPVEYDSMANTARFLTRYNNRVWQYSVISHVRTSTKPAAPVSSPSFDRRRDSAVVSPAERPQVNLRKSAASIASAFQQSFERGLQESTRAARKLGNAAAFEKAYLQLPRSPRQDEIGALAGSIIVKANATSARDKALAIERYLQGNYEYSLSDLSFGRREPTEAFLLDEKRGHCEYFASALALMLRHVGVPTRIVNGFYTDRWNDLGGYYQVEKSDAHSWVEAFIDEEGWTAFDATPPGFISRESAARGWLYRTRFLMDAVQMKWRMYVIDYDLRDQGQLLRTLEEKTPEHIGPIARWISQSRRFLSYDGSMRAATGKIVLAVAVFVSAILAAAGVFALSRLASRRRRTSRFQALLQKRRVALYEKILKALGKRGLHRSPGATPLEFAREVEASRPDLAGFIPLTRQYYEVRFAERPMDIVDVDAFTAFLKQVRTRPPRHQAKSA